MCNCAYVFRIQEHLKYRLQYKSYESYIPKNAYSCNNLKMANYVPFTYACLKRTSENEHWINSYLAEQIEWEFTQPFTSSSWLSFLSWRKNVFARFRAILHGALWASGSNNQFRNYKFEFSRTFCRLDQLLQVWFVRFLFHFRKRKLIRLFFLNREIQNSWFWNWLLKSGEL